MTDYSEFIPDRMTPEEEAEERLEREAIRSEAGTTDPEHVLNLEAHARERLSRELEERELDAELKKSKIPKSSLHTAFPLNEMKMLNDVVLSDLRVRKKDEPIDAVPTAFPTLNKVCMMQGGQQGFAHGWHVVIGAASNVGKTNVALNTIRAALEFGEHVLYFALEEEIEDVACRLMAAALRKPLRFVTRGKQFDIEADREAARIITDWPGKLFVNRQPVVQLEHIESIIDAFHAHFGTRTFVLDYLQLAETAGARTETELYAKVREISDVVRTKAKTDRLLSIALSQLNRVAASNWKQCPRIYDLLGGGPIEQHADVVGLICHCEKHFKEEPQKRQTSTRFIVGKNRKGIRGGFPIRFDWNESRCYEVDEERDEEIIRPQYPGSKAKVGRQTDAFDE